MTIEVALVISLLGLAVSLYFNMANSGRAERAENKQDASAITTVIVKLENIADDIREIKKERGVMQEEQKKIVERVAIVEQSSKNGHKRLDEFNDRLHEFEGRLEGGNKK